MKAVLVDQSAGLLSFIPFVSRTPLDFPCTSSLTEEKESRRKNCPTLRQLVFDDTAIIIPAGIWHNLTNIGHTPLKLYSIYAPPEHPWGTVHETKADAEAAE